MHFCEFRVFRVQGGNFLVHHNFPQVHGFSVGVHHDPPRRPPTVPQHPFRVGWHPVRGARLRCPPRIFPPGLNFLDPPHSAKTSRGQALTGPRLGPAPPALSIRAFVWVDRRTSLRERKVLGASRVTPPLLGGNHFLPGVSPANPRFSFRTPTHYPI